MYIRKTGNANISTQKLKSHNMTRTIIGKLLRFTGVISLVVCITSSLYSQAKSTLSLAEAYSLIEQEYPNLKNSDVLDQMYQRELDGLEKGRLPELFLKADSRVQSENLKIVTEPGSPVPFEFELPLFSAKAMVEAKYDILDGGFNEAQKTLKTVQLLADMQNIEVQRYSLHEHINQLFVNIILLREQSILYDYSLDDLASRKNLVAAGVEFGTVLPSELTRIAVSELQLKSQRTDARTRVSGMIRTLSKLLGVELDVDIVLELPNLEDAEIIPELNRPEIELFDLQREAVLAQSDMIDVSRRPHLSAFAQAGVGYPNPVNLFDVNGAPFGLIGVNFAWRITDWKKQDLERDILSLKAQQIQYAKETFKFNLNTQEENYLSEIYRIRDLTAIDQEIADLESVILDQLAAQLEEGVITSAEYISQVNAELRARQNLLIHETELLKTQLDFWNSRGGL
jgi:outer membrane protein TolC